MPSPLRSAIRNLSAAGLAALFAAAHAAALGTPTLAWQRCPVEGFCQRGWYASPAVSDVDRDGVVEVLWGGYALMSVRGDTGALEWVYQAPESDRIWSAPAVADLDGDGPREVVVAEYDRISVLDASGTPREGWPLRVFGDSEVRTLAVADLDRDGAQEILVARASGGSYDTWSVLAADGGTRDGWPRLDAGEDSGYAWGAYNQNVAAGDLDGDGDLEIIGPSDVHYVSAFADSGDALHAAPLYGANKPWNRVGVHYEHATDLVGYADCGAGPPDSVRPNFADSAPAIGDLDGDGVNEIVVIGSFYDCGSLEYTQLFQLPLVFEADRTRWVAPGFDWTDLPAPDAFAAPISTDYAEIETALPNPVLADLDGDGVREILYASYDGRVHAFEAGAKTEPGAWPFDVNLGADTKRFASEPAVADLDGDGAAEVVFTTWTAIGSGEAGRLYIVSASGLELASVEVPRSTQSWDGALGAPSLANLDGDPEIEVVIGTAHTGLVAYEIPGSQTGRTPWPTGRGSVLRNAPEPGAAAGCFTATAALALLASWRRT